MSTKQKILIVDDRVENLIALERVLRPLEVDIVKALSGEEALRSAVDNIFSLAILDVQMPGMNGYELADLLCGGKTTGRIPIIFMSAVYSDDSHVFKGYQAGAVDFLVKPYNPEHLISKVSVFLELSRINKELEAKVEMLATSEEQFRSLVRTIPDIVYRINEDGIFTYINEAVSLLDYTPSELIGSHFSKIIHPDDIDSISRKIVLPKLKKEGCIPEIAPKLFDERRSDKRKTVELEIRLIFNNHKKKIVKGKLTGDVYKMAEVNSSGILGGQGRNKKIFLGTVGVIRDISVRKQAEEELSQYRNKLEELVEERTKDLKMEIEKKEKLQEEQKKMESMLQQQQRLESIGILAGGVAHEINNPINGIMNYAQLIIDTPGCIKEVYEYTDMILEETLRVSKIVKNLLQFARTDQQTIEEEVPVSKIIDYVLSLINTLMRHSQIEIKIIIPNDFPEIKCRSSEIEQVLMNLLTNACDSLNEKYEGWHEDKIIIIEVSKFDLNNITYVRFMVEDHGNGISKKNALNVFEPFFTTKDRAKGTGLGLSISHGLVNKHGGSLSFETEEGRFTKFFIDMPLKGSKL